MPGDAKECRQHALQCAELAEKAQSPERAKVFQNLAKQWLKLAIELERAYAFRDEFEPRPKKRLDNGGSDDDAPRSSFRRR